MDQVSKFRVLVEVCNNTIMKFQTFLAILILFAITACQKEP